MTGHAHVLTAVIPSWSSVVRMGDSPTGADNDIPVRVVFVSPAGPGAWVDTDLDTALRLVTKLSVDLNAIVAATQEQGA